MKNPIFDVLVLYFEFKANRLRPAILKYLYDQRAYWRRTLEKFHNDEGVTRLVHNSEEEIMKAIRDIENELTFENTYQLLKMKYRNDKRMLVSIAANYCTFWACLEFCRKTQNVNATDPTYANTALEFGSKKMQVYARFENLLNT